ncbi:SMI1/KNR4 family protein [Paenibacillus sp. 481]|uniref:SMI1/KNR4 family protein n=1 Tax=Paenibacillus sp. 481 TaxID=2835869 RepID=UPI001E4C7849|nr:SMI1/KNR4 family protein [Paenibacillus sp. 481]UHA73436.1 SMI1/KNR4 family protein [Paenibacillus sp. 481]
MKSNSIQEIEQHYGVVFPPEYLSFLELSSGKSFNFTETEDFTDWEVRFSDLDGKFIATTRSLVDDVNPDPMKLIPIAWSVSSGNNYLLDYRTNPTSPSVVLMDHEEAIVREDAESESDTPEEAQQLMEENVREVAIDFAEFAARLVDEEEAEQHSF